MRLDKDLWNSSCREYAPYSVGAQQTDFLRASARVFLSLWLELVQDDRAPETRALRSLAIPDQLIELQNAMRLREKTGKPSYRVRAGVRRLRRQSEGIQCDFVGRVELNRLCEDANSWLVLVDESDQRTRKKLEDSARGKLGLPIGVDVEDAYRRLIESAIVGTLSQIRGHPEFKDALCAHVSTKLADANIGPRQFYKDCTAAIQELLALVLDRGNSRESLAELPVKYLRADNQSLMNATLPERVGKIFGAFRGNRQEYEVYLPIEATQVQIHGEIFPPGVTLVNSNDWDQIVTDFAQVTDSNLLSGHGTAFRVEIDRYLSSGLAPSESPPLDVFAARDVAVRAAEACLDAIFLYREHRIRLDRPCAVIVTNVSPQYRCVLHQRNEFRIRPQIELDFLRPVPAAWSDALHWYRLGNVTNKDESGVVNLWTSAELLSASCHGIHGTAIDRVRNSVGLTAAVYLFSDFYLYLANGAREYGRRYNRGTLLHVPPDDAKENEVLQWWLSLCDTCDEQTLFEQMFDLFPTLAIEAMSTKDLLATKNSKPYDDHKEQVADELAWIYGCRNDVVHDGRIRVAGAAIARALAAEYVGTTLRETLTMRARGNTIALGDCFALAQEKERTLRSHLEQGKIIEALMTPYR